VRLEGLRQELVRLHAELPRHQLVVWTGGNVSARDPETGLIDFPAERDGERVFLCWRLGEDEVAFYHGEHSGFSGRKPW